MQKTININIPEIRLPNQTDVENAVGKSAQCAVKGVCGVFKLGGRLISSTGKGLGKGAGKLGRKVKAFTTTK